MSPPTWFITGCSSGFGLAVALHALRAGHQVIATSRNPSKTPDVVSEVESLGGKWLKLDVASAELDAQVGSCDCRLPHREREYKLQMVTNFFGPLKICQRVVPAMRERRSGVIINISSSSGVTARACRGMYQASKFALEALSGALYDEMQPFNVRVLLVEPGAFATPFVSSCQLPVAPLPADYKGTMTEMVITMTQQAATGTEAPGDTTKGAKVIFDVVMKEGVGKNLVDANGKEFLRLPLGIDCVKKWRDTVEQLEENLKGTEEIAGSTNRDNL